MAESGAQVEVRRTWDNRRALHPLWAADNGPGWLPLGLERDECGCIRDHWNYGPTVGEPKMWEPCMAHEGQGHLSAVSGDPDKGTHIARCLVLACGWTETRFHENSAVEAAQQHWRETVHD